MKLFLIAATALMVACGFQMNWGGQYLIYIDPAFTPDRQGEIREAIGEWNQVSEGNITLIETASPKGSHVIQVWADHTQRASGQAGECVPFYETIKLQDDMKVDQTRRTALHEIGHAFGLEHDHEGTIMCFSLACAPKHLTCDDLRQFCSIWKCDASTLAVCQ